MTHPRFAVLCLVPMLTWAQARAGDDRQSDDRQYVFGTTVVDNSGLQGRIYHLKPKTGKLPDFQRLKPVGAVYTTSLNVWPQSFTVGFPSVTDRFEWFGIDYTGKFWIENAGDYRFSLLSDDGARLKLNGQVVLDNDGLHGPAAVSAAATLTRGVHEIEVEYFQGPREWVALVLAIEPPGEAWRIFKMEEFKPPKDPEEWVKGEISAIRDRTMR